ncbi:helix-turn-helix domain-containing protein [Roseateles flavus]|uniref:Helix-turn-helix transcriptional regulator n=1 Tax=Roseateles flavus TaxID=3149041 RepID=A0ABV0GGF2_9BURK
MAIEKRNILLEIGQRLLAERKRLEMTQERMAVLAGVSKRSLTGYEAGERPMDVTTITGLQEAGVDVMYLLTGEVDAGKLSPVEMDLVVNFRTLDDRGRAGVLGMIRGYNLAQPPSDEGRVLIKGDVGQTITGGQVDQSQASFSVGGGRRRR